MRALRSFLTEVLAVSQFLAGARRQTLVAKAAMCDADKQAQAPIAQLLRGHMQGLAASGAAAAAAAAEGAAAAAEGATEGASSSSPTLMCLLLLVLRATASEGQARPVTPPSDRIPPAVLHEVTGMTS